MRTVHLVLASFLLLVPMVARANSEGFGSLTPQEVAARLKQKNVYVFDNNDPDVYKSGHLPHAKWVHPSEYDAKELPADKNATLIFYCHNEY
ncbi:MAG TPA: rhodanese-like domain-containing protein [Polyangia bacterium]|jgi:rhodanese-related sulfurtransferase